MTLPVKIIIPWRPEPSRMAGFEWLLRYYAHRFGNDAVHVETDGSEEPFNKSRTINLAVSRFLGYVCVITDADVFICDWTLRESMRLASRRDFLYLLHNCICRMTQHQSRQPLRQHPGKRVSGQMHRKQRTAACPGGIWVVRSDLFLQYEMVVSFPGWGCEDTELLRRIPHIRLAGPMFYIWHGKASRRVLRARIIPPVKLTPRTPNPSTGSNYPSTSPT